MMKSSNRGFKLRMKRSIRIHDEKSWLRHKGHGGMRGPEADALWEKARSIYECSRPRSPGGAWIGNYMKGWEKGECKWCDRNRAAVQVHLIHLLIKLEVLK
jgi:hypothetical protein